MIIVGNRVFCQQYTPFYQLLSSNKKLFLTSAVISQNAQPATVLRADFYCTQLGFFCKKELKLESVTRIPFRFRLGSLQYNDWLEGKKNAGILPAN